MYNLKWNRFEISLFSFFKDSYLITFRQMRVSKVYFVNEICSKGFPEMADKNKSRVGIDLMSTLNIVGVPPFLAMILGPPPVLWTWDMPISSPIMPTPVVSAWTKSVGSGVKSRDLTGYKQAGRFFSAAKS